MEESQIISPHPPSQFRRESSEANPGGKRRNSRHRQKRRVQTRIPRFPSATNPAKRIVAEKRRNSHHSAVFGKAGNGAVVGISELVEVAGAE